MAEIFLSYSRADSHRAAEVVAELKARGHQVWWDQELQPGDNWSRELELVLDRAGYVVVLWTPKSVESDWVQKEAALALERRKLIPVLLEDCAPPKAFTHIQTADLRTASDEQYRKIDGALRGRRRRLPALSIAALILAAAAWLASTPRPTTVDIDLPVSGVQFRTPQLLVDSANLVSLDLRGFTSLRLPDAEASIADPARYDLKSDSYPANAWKSLPAGELVLTPGSPAATLMIRGSGSIALEQLQTGAAHVTLTSTPPRGVSIRLRTAAPQGSVQMPEEFLAVADSCVWKGGKWPYPGQQVTLRIRLPRAPRLMEFTGRKEGMLFGLEFPAAASLLRNSGLAIDQAEFLTQGSAGPESTIIGQGFVRFPGSTAAAVEVNKGDFLRLAQLHAFRLTDAVTGEQGLRLKLHGTAGELTIGPAGDEQDRRLSWWRIR